MLRLVNVEKFDLMDENLDSVVSIRNVELLSAHTSKENVRVERRVLK